MKARNGSGTVAAIGAVVGLAALGAAGYHLASGNCPLGGCQSTKAGVAVTTVAGAMANDRGECPLGGGSCSMGATVATTEAAFFEVVANADVVACEETERKSCCMSGETAETKPVEQTASSAK
jgi:hypothetical protein